MQVLLIGPLPPPFGGATVLFKLLVDQLTSQGEENIVVFDTACSGRFLMLIRLMKSLLQYHVVSFHASSKNLILIGGVFSIICRLLRKRCVLRVFGGNLLEVADSLGVVGKICLGSVLKSDAILVEMKELRMSVLERNPQAKVYWFPNSRVFDRELVTALPCCSGSPLRFGYFAHVRREKGIIELVEATKLLSYMAEFEVHIYGKLYDNVEASVFEDCDNLFFHGEIEPDDVLHKMQECDVIVLPTWYDGEGYPGTLIEAFGLGRPVISTNWRFITELVEHEISGLLVPVKDSQSLMEAMKRLDSDRAFLIELAINATKVAENLSSEYWNGEVFMKICNGDELFSPEL